MEERTDGLSAGDGDIPKHMKVLPPKIARPFPG